MPDNATTMTEQEMDAVLEKLPYGVPSEFSGADILGELDNQGWVVVRKSKDDPAALGIETKEGDVFRIGGDDCVFEVEDSFVRLTVDNGEGHMAFAMFDAATASALGRWLLQQTGDEPATLLAERESSYVR